MKKTLIFGYLLVSAAMARGQDAPPAAPAADGRSREQEKLTRYRSVFGPMFGRPESGLMSDRTPTTTTALLDAAQTSAMRELSLQIDDVGRHAPLSEPQRKKLHAAGARDIRRFFDRAEQNVNEYLDSSSDPSKRQEISELMKTRMVLNHDFDVGLFGPGSFFFKVVDSTLDETQASKWRESRDKRTRTLWRIRAHLMAQSWSELVGLTDEQRRKLSELIIAEIPPPDRSGPADFQFIMYRLNQLPREKLRPIFDGPQWQLFSGRLDAVLRSKKLYQENLIRLGYDLGDSKEPMPKSEPAK
jgi:hypothetical protein